MKNCTHTDVEGNKHYTWTQRDARGIPLGGLMCDDCCDWVMEDNRRRYRADVFEDSNYWADERIEEHA